MEGDLEMEDDNLIFSVEDYRPATTLARLVSAADMHTHYDEEPLPQGSKEEGHEAISNISSPGGARSRSFSASWRQSLSLTRSSPPPAATTTTTVTTTPPPSPATPSRAVPIRSSAASTAARRLQLFQSAPGDALWGATAGSLDESSADPDTRVGVMYRSAESSATAATGAGAQPRPRSASKIIDFALAQVVAPSSTTLGGAFPQLSTSFDSEFDLNTEMMAHKGAFRDALTLRDEQLLMRLKQKQRELKQMEAALLKKQEEYLLIKVQR
jgi:hypothetical protein